MLHIYEQAVLGRACTGFYLGELLPTEGLYLPGPLVFIAFTAKPERSVLFIYGWVLNGVPVPFSH